jgi:hypothetical protein
MDDRHRGTGTRWRLSRSLSWGSAVLALAGGLALAASTGAGAAPFSPGKAAPSPSFAQASGITLPTGASATAVSQLIGLGCTPSGAYCVAGGYFGTSSTSSSLPMIVTYSNGSWGKAQRLQLPTNAQSAPHAEVTAVSCPTSTSCVAVGFYRYKNSGSNRNAFAAQQSSSGWARAHTLPLPPNVNLSPHINAWGQGITCPSASNCTAIGQYVDKDLDHESFAINESGGTWVQGHWIPTPPDAPSRGKNVQPYGVACSSNTSCEIVGKYQTANGDTEPYVVQGQTNATWTATAARAGLPAGALSGKSQVADLRGVQCFSAGNCFAVGNYLMATSGGSTPAVYYLTESGGTWASNGTQFTAAPADAASPPKSMVSGLYCFDSADCLTVGNYTNTSSLASPFADAYSTGPVWQTALSVIPPSGYQSASLKGISCWGTVPWTCAAAGAYVNSSGHTLPMVATSS